MAHAAARCLRMAALLFLLAPTLIQATFQPGRATWFDVHEDDLRTANCHMPWSAISTGRFAAALSDRNPYFSNSCGMCLEVRCQNANFRDGYGATLERSNACRDGRSIIVTVADACPCEYDNNQYSNSRWCCNDSERDHIDITREAFASLADLKLGVIAIQWRVVDCASRQPADGSGPATPGASSSPSSAPSTGDARSFDHSPFETSAGTGLNAELVQGQMGAANSVQQDAQKRIAEAKQRRAAGVQVRGNAEPVLRTAC